MKNIKLNKKLKERILRNIYQSEISYQFVIRSHSAFGRTCQQISEKLLFDIREWCNKYGVTIDVNYNNYEQNYIKPSNGSIVFTIRDGDFVKLINEIVNSKQNPYFSKPKKQEIIGINCI